MARCTANVMVLSRCHGAKLMAGVESWYRLALNLTTLCWLTVLGGAVLGGTVLVGTAVGSTVVATVCWESLR